MELKELIGEELATKLVAMPDETVKQAISKLTTAKLMIGDATSFVSKSDFNEKNEALKAAKELIKKHEADLEDLKGKAAGSVTLQAQITELQNANKTAKAEYDASIAKERKSLALKSSLLSAGAVNDDKALTLLSKLFDVDKIELDDKGEVKGIIDLIKPIKENAVFKSMFGAVVLQGQQHQDGSSPSSVLSALEQQLAEAQKNHKMTEVVTLRRKIAEEQQKV
jgi:hypothetical protein